MLALGRAPPGWWRNGRPARRGVRPRVLRGGSRRGRVAPSGAGVAGSVTEGGSRGSGARKAARRRRQFSEWYRDLLKYKDEHGHCKVPQNYPGGLGKWVSRQRAKWKYGVLDTEDYHRLCAVGFVFDADEHTWAQHFQNLCDFHSRHGHCNVSHTDRDAAVKYPGLADWVSLQRHSRKRGRLPEDRLRRLSGLDFVWQQQEHRWQQRLNELAEFQKEYGHCNVPRDWPENPQLGAWVNAVRKKYQGVGDNVASITDAQEAALKAIGFDFAPRERSWNDNYVLLRELVAENGSLGTRLPNSGKYAGLRDWASRQTYLNRTGQLSRERWRRLNVVGFVWDVKELAWNSGLKVLGEIVEERGPQTAYLCLELLDGAPLLKEAKSGGRSNVVGSPVSEDEANLRDLVAWFRNTRRAALAGELSVERMGQLGALGFLWNVEGDVGGL